MHDGRWTTHDDGQRPTAMGHMSDSGDLTLIDIYLLSWNVMLIPVYLNGKLDILKRLGGQGNYPSD